MQIARVFIVACVFAALAGCGDKTVAMGPNGEKVTTDGSGNVRVDDGKGNVSEMNTSPDGTTTIKNNKGAEVTYDKSGMKGVDDKGNKFEVGTSSVTEEELGVSFYPGSEATQQDLKSESNGQKTFHSSRTTSDAPAKVTAFYKPNIKDATTAESGNMAMVSGKLADGRTIGVVASQTDGKTTVQVTVTDDKK